MEPSTYNIELEVFNRKRAGVLANDPLLLVEENQLQYQELVSRFIERFPEVGLLSPVPKTTDIREKKTILSTLMSKLIITWSYFKYFITSHLAPSRKIDKLIKQVSSLNKRVTSLETNLKARNEE